MTLDMTDQAYVFFVQESLELMQILEQGLITLSQEHDLSKLHSLMRAAHSIKGGAACVGLDGIQQIAHELENGIRALYPGDTVFDEELEDLMLKGFDCLRLPLTEQIETGICDDVTALALAQPIFRQIETKIGCSLEEAAELPEVPMQTDMTLFLFQEEVPSGLRRLASLIHQHPQPTDLIAELTSQLEVLGTFGSMLNLIGFSAIANTALKALQVNPDQAVNIIELALSDFWAGQQAVLLGDRIQGGQPVAALFELTRADLSPGEFAPRSSIEPTMAEELTRDELTSITEALAGFDLDALEGFSEVEFPEEDLPDLSEDEPSNESFEGRVVEAEPSTVISIEPLKTASNQMFQSSSPANPQSVETQTKPDQTSTRLGIRIDLNRLEKINTLVGELTTQDNAFLLRNQQNQTAVETLSKTWQKFKKLVVQLQGLTDIDPMLEFTQDLYQSSTRTSQSSSHGLAHLLNQVGLSPELLTKTLEDAEQLDKILYDMRLSSLQGQQLLKKRQTTLHQVQKQLTETRMVSVATLLERFPRMLRDLSRQKQKPVKLEITGQDTLIDQVILEKLYDPLVHVVRNAFEHGIEPGDIRRAQGKSEQGTIQVKAYHQGNYTYLEIQDDGQGINLDKVRAKAVRQGLVSHSDAHKLSTAKLYDLLFIPGFSTTETVTDLSGRGAGLDAVRHQIASLKGSISIQSESGKGTKFTLQLPWLLTVTRLLVFQVAGTLLAIPMDALSTIISVARQDIKFDSNQEIYNWLGQHVPLIQSLLLDYRYPDLIVNSLGHQPQNSSKNREAATLSLTPSSTIDLAIDLANSPGSNFRNKLTSESPLETTSDQSLVLLLSKDLETIGLRIDQVVMEQNLAIKPFSQTLAPPAYFYGCTALGDGRLVPVIDGARLLDTWIRQQRAETDEDRLLLMPQPKLLQPQPQATILVIDDSITTRQSLCANLYQSGYQILQAQNGREGLRQLQQHPEIQLVICDLEMPEMNGFEFLSHCRRQFPKEKLPILMLTSRTSDRYRQLAQQLGANGYVTKPWQNNNLLNLLQDLL